MYKVKKVLAAVLVAVMTLTIGTIVATAEGDLEYNEAGDDGTIIGNTISISEEWIETSEDELSGTFGEDFVVQWFRDGEPISGATGASYTITEDDLGKTITVKWARSDDLEDAREPYDYDDDELWMLLDGSVDIPLGFTVTYHKNDGSDDKIEVKGFKENASHAARDASTFSRSGYTFLRWTTESGGTGDSYAAGDAVTVTDDMDMYAQWERVAREATTPKTGVSTNMTLLLIVLGTSALGIVFFAVILRKRITEN